MGERKGRKEGGGKKEEEEKEALFHSSGLLPRSRTLAAFFFHLEKTSPPLQIPQAFLSRLCHEGRKEPLSTEAKSSAARLAMLHPGKGLRHVVPMAEISFSADTLVKFLA